MFSLVNKKAVITGGGSGIGKAIAVTFAAQGASVHVLELTTEAGADTAATIKAAGGQVTVHACNVASKEEVAAVFASIGQLDILVNNAGVAHIGKADTTPEADFDRVMSINVKGVYQCIAAAIPGFRANGRGVIINMASIAAWVGLADRFVYSTAKGAVMAMTLSVAKDYMHENIRCNFSSQAFVGTPCPYTHLTVPVASEWTLGSLAFPQSTNFERKTCQFCDCRVSSLNFLRSESY